MRTPFLTHESTMRVKNKPKLAKKGAESKMDALVIGFLQDHYY